MFMQQPLHKHAFLVAVGSLTLNGHPASSVSRAGIWQTVLSFCRRRGAPHTTKTRNRMTAAVRNREEKPVNKVKDGYDTLMSGQVFSRRCVPQSAIMPW